MTREARLGRALVLVVLAIAVQPLFAAACMSLDHDGMAPPPHGTALFSASASTDDEALEIVFGGDPGIFASALVLPRPEPNALLRPPDASHALPNVSDSADHPPRRA